MGLTAHSVQLARAGCRLPALSHFPALVVLRAFPDLREALLSLMTTGQGLARHIAPEMTPSFAPATGPAARVTFPGPMPYFLRAGRGGSPVGLPGLPAGGDPAGFWNCGRTGAPRSHLSGLAWPAGGVGS